MVIVNGDATSWWWPATMRRNGGAWRHNCNGGTRVGTLAPVSSSSIRANLFFISDSHSKFSFTFWNSSFTISCDFSLHIVTTTTPIITFLIRVHINLIPQTTTFSDFDQGIEAVKVRWLITSRNMTDIEYKLEFKSLILSQGTTLEEDEQELSRLIDNFVKLPANVVWFTITRINGFTNTT